jgi:hypothetical protein
METHMEEYGILPDMVIQWIGILPDMVIQWIDSRENLRLKPFKKKTWFLPPIIRTIFSIKPTDVYRKHTQEHSMWCCFAEICASFWRQLHHGRPIHQGFPSSPKFEGKGSNR